jgi:hypothetical protein
MNNDIVNFIILGIYGILVITYCWHLTVKKIGIFSRIFLTISRKGK